MSLEVFYQILKPQGRVCMIWPQFRAEGKIWKMNPSIGKLLVSKENRNLVYGRDNQKVWREIVVLEKN